MCVVRVRSFFPGASAAVCSRLKVRCCWKGREGKPLIIGLLNSQQRPLSVISGRAWSASCLKWYPEPQHHRGSCILMRRKWQSHERHIRPGKIFFNLHHHISVKRLNWKVWTHSLKVHYLHYYSRYKTWCWRKIFSKNIIQKNILVYIYNTIQKSRVT